MRISDWSSDVCSSDLVLSESKGGIEGWPVQGLPGRRPARPRNWRCRRQPSSAIPIFSLKFVKSLLTLCGKIPIYTNGLGQLAWGSLRWPGRSEEHTSELQSLMRNSYAVFCLKKKKHTYYKKN